MYTTDVCIFIDCSISKLQTLHINARMLTDHVELALVVDDGGDGEGDDHAGGQGQVGIDDRPVLVIPRGKGAVEARPVHPQENCTWK